MCFGWNDEKECDFGLKCLRYESARCGWLSGIGGVVAVGMKDERWKRWFEGLGFGAWGQS